MVVVAITAAVYGTWQRNLLEKRRTMNAIASKGGFVWNYIVDYHVEIEFEKPLHVGCGVIHLWSSPSFVSGRFSDADLPLIDKLNRVRAVSFANTDVSAAAIEKFRRSHPQCRVSE
jgi:hypothetical protein